MGNSSVLGGMGSPLLRRAHSGRMTEEADYPPSYCVRDQDKQANPPLREDSGVKKEGAGRVR